MQMIAGGDVNHSGTFNGYVAGLAAAAATIDELSRDNGCAFEQIRIAGSILMDEIPHLFRQRSFPCLVQGLPCRFFVGFTEQERIKDAQTAARCNYSLFNQLVCALMRRGVRLVPGGSFTLSAAHTTQDAHETLSRIDDALKELRT
jgi:glutamate-1-semialdehyde 2,1-aminomutase